MVFEAPTGQVYHSRMLTWIARRLSAVVAFMCVAIVYSALAFACLPTGAQWSPDTGLRRLQAQNVRFTPWPELDLPYPGQWLDPALKFVPLAPPVRFQQDGQIFLTPPAAIAILSQPFIRRWGDAGERVVPVLAGLLSVALTAFLVRRWTDRPAWLGVCAAGLATPLLFYSLNFWEHTLAVALGLGAVALAFGAETPSRGALALSGVLTGLAVAAREEMILLGAITLILMLWRGRHELRSAALWTAAWIATLSLWRLMNGGLLPAHLRFNLLTGPLAHAYLLQHPWSGLADFLFTPQHRALSGASFGALIALWLISRRPLSPLRSVGQALAMTALGVSAACMAAQAQPGFGLFGLLSVSPWLVCALASPPAAGASPEREVRRSGEGVPEAGVRALGPGIFLLYVLSLGLLTPVGPLHSALEWGARLALIVFPLLTPFALRGLHGLWIETRRSRWAWQPFLAALGLMGISLGIQARGVAILQSSLTAGQALREAILELPERQVLTGLLLIPMRVPETYAAKELYYVETPETAREWLQAAAAHGVTRFAYVGYRMLDQTGWEAIRPAGKRVLILSAESLGDGIIVMRLALEPGP